MYLRLNTNSSCNLDCTHCYYKAKVGFDGTTMHLKDAKRLIDQTYNIYGDDLNLVIMGGGEPFLYKDLFELLEYVREELNINVSITTNGILLEENHLIKLRELNVLLNISLEGNKLYNDKIRGNGTFDTIIRNIIKAIKIGTRFSINFTLTKENIIDIPFLVKLCSKNAEYITFSRYIPYLKNKDIKPLSPSDYLIVEKIISKYKNKKLVYRQENFFRKNERIRTSYKFDLLKLTSLYVLPDLSIYPAWNLIDYKLGNLNDSKLEDILNNGKIEKLYNPNNLNGKYCSTCEYKFSCVGDRGVAYFYNKNFWGDDPQCPYYKINDLENDNGK